MAWIGSVPSLILHTGIFLAFFTLSFSGFLSWDLMFLILTTLVSLEAIYLSIFIQMTVNRQGQSLKEVEADVEEIQDDIGEIQVDVEEMSEDIEEMSEDEKAANLEAQKLASLDRLTADVQRLLHDLEILKKER